MKKKCELALLKVRKLKKNLDLCVKQANAQLYLSGTSTSEYFTSSKASVFLRNTDPLCNIIASPYTLCLLKRLKIYFKHHALCNSQQSLLCNGRGRIIHHSFPECIIYSLLLCIKCIYTLSISAYAEIMTGKIFNMLFFRFHFDLSEYKPSERTAYDCS